MLVDNRGHVGVQEIGCCEAARPAFTCRRVRQLADMLRHGLLQGSSACSACSACHRVFMPYLLVPAFSVRVKHALHCSLQPRRPS